MDLLLIILAPIPILLVVGVLSAEHRIARIQRDVAEIRSLLSSRLPPEE
jgi:hypothetical protein